MTRKLLFYFFALIGFTASAQYDISVTNTDHQAAYIPGFTAVYTVTVTNNGPGDATGVQVSNPIPAGITSFQWSGDNFSSGANVPLADTIDLLAGESVTYTILVAVPAGYVGPTLVSQASVTTTPADTDLTNNTAIDTDIVPVGADIVVNKTDGSTSYTAGNTVTYTIMVENHGPAVAANVSAQDVLPALIDPTTVTWSGSNGSSGTGAMSDNIGDMAVGAIVTYTVTVPVPSDFPQDQDLVNVASASSAGTPDPNTECVGCTDTDTPDPKADLVTVKTNGQTEYVMGEDTVYTITITNNGPSDADNVVVTDNLPPATSQMSWTGSNGASGTGNLSDTVAHLAAGDSLTYVVTLGVPFGYNITVGNLVNVVSVTSDTPDPVPACPGCTDIDTPAPKWVTVDNTTYIVPDLVENVLIDSDCANVSNFTWQAGSGANSGIGLFKKNNSNFPLKDGVVIRCGNAKLCEGPFDDTQNSSTGSGSPDTNSIGFPSSDGQDLHGVSVANGNPGSINDVSYIQFDFIPLTDNFSFKFLFASNEYGQYQCTFGDVFAFILKDQVTGTLQNLAVIPGTNTPVSVTSIRDGAYNSGCGSVNPSFFGAYNLGTPTNAAISMRGQTIPMVASASVIPNHLYTIKLAIGDYLDSLLDSAVFIEAGSFNVGGVDLGDDQLVSAGTAGCDGSTQTLSSQLDPTIWSFEWEHDGVVLPDTTPSITVSEGGQYCVKASNSTCEQTDCITVEFRPEVIPVSQAPFDLIQTSPVLFGTTATFDLSEIEPHMFGALNPANYELYYYHSIADADLGASPILNFANYPGTNGEVIYVRVTETNSGFDCNSTFSFTLHVITNLVECDDASNDGFANFDLTQENPLLLASHPASDYTISYYTSQANADNQVNAIPAADLPAYQNLTNPQTIYVGLVNNLNGTYATGHFDIQVVTAPAATVSAPAFICSGETATVTFNGTPGATVTYNADGGASQSVALDLSGVGMVTTPVLTAPSTYNLESISLPGGCTAALTGSATVGIQALPTVAISGTTSICSGQNADITFTGTPGATVTYTVDSGANQTVLLDASGVAVVNTGPVSTQTIYGLVSVQDGSALGCQQNQTGSVTISIGGLPTASISGNTTICPGDTATITFTGTPGATVTFDDGTSTFSVLLDATGSASYTTPVLGATRTYNLQSVSVGSAPGSCSQPQSGSVTITVSPLPVASISGAATICSGASTVVTFMGTANATVSYNIDGGVTQTIVLDASGAGTVSTGNITATRVYNLESVQAGAAPNCSQAQAGSVTITVLPLPVAAISGDTSICSGQSATITFSGTAGATVHYTVNGGAAASITLDGAGSASLSTGALSATSVYALVDATSATTPPCTQGQAGTATVTVLPLPTAAVSGTIAVCQGGPAPEITFTGSGGTPPYVFSYNVNGGPTLATPPSTVDTFTITAPTGTVGTFNYNLVSVQDAGGAGCSQAQSATATVTVGAPPVIFAPSQIDVCDDNNDGFAHFDLTPAIAQVTGGNPNLVVSFYETLTDAQTGNNPIGDYTDYTNISPWVQTIYVRAVDATTPGCPAITTLALQVNRVPVPNTTIDDYHLCDVNSPGDNQEAFTLQSWNGHVDADAPAGAVFSYYHSQGAAQGGTGAISDPYTNSVNHEQVWVRIEDGATGCFAVASFYLVVDPLPAVSPATINICGGASGLGETFDLTSVSLDVSGGIPGMSVDYYLAQADALAGNANTIADPQHFVNTANPQTLYAVVRNVATGCFNVTTVTLSVSQGPVLGTPAALVECDDNNDGFATFDLTASYMDIFGSATPPAGITVTIHETLTDAQTGDTPKASPYTNIDPNDQIVYVRATYDATGCYSIVELPLHVNPVPVGSDVTYPVCDDDLDGIGSFDLTTIVDDVLGGLDQSLYSVSFYLTLPQAQAQTPAITNVLNFHNTTPGQQVIYAVVRDNATGCNDIVEVTLTVSPLPGVPVSGAAPYTLCDVNNPGDQQEEFDLSSQIPGILAGQSGVDVSFYLNQADAQVPQSPLPMLYTNLAGSNPQTIWVRLENTTTHCVAYTTLDLRVAPLPVLVPPMDPVVECDPDGDGFAPFDLQALIPDMLQGATGITVTFHETMTDAQGGVGPLANPYTNIVAFDQVVYVRAEDTATGCSSVMALPIKVIPSPQLPPLSPDHDIVMCDQDANNQSGTTVFDLTQNEGYILGLQSGPPSAYTITYYTNQPDAQTGTSGAIVPSTHYTNVANPQTIWVRIEGAGTDCYNVSSFQISVNTPLALTHPTNLNLCDDGPTSAIPQTVFDLRVKQAEILGGASPADYTFTWYGSMSDYLAHSPIGDPSAYTNVANPQTVVAEVTSPEGCRSFTTLTIRVIPLPNPRTANLPYPRYEACDDNLPVGTEAFDLTLNETYIRNNDPDLVFEYYDTLAGAQSGVGAIGDPTNHQTATGMIYIRVVRHLEQDINGRYCAVILSVPVVVHPLPDVQPWADTQCGAGTSLSGTFTLSDYNDNVMVSGDTTGYSFAYFPDLASAQGGTGQLPDAYTTTSNPQVITVRVTDDATGCVNYTSLTLGVMAGAVASAPTGLAQCGIDQYGFMDVDLTQFDTEVLSGQDPASFTVAYFATAGDAAVGTSPLASPFNTTSVTLWAVVTNTATGCRSVAVPVSITIEPLANPVIDNTSNTICVEWGTGALLSGLTLHSNLSSNAGYTLEWFYQGQSVGTGDTYTISDPEGYGDYTVVATSISALGCVSAPSQVFTVVRSGPAVAAAGTIGYSVSDAFEGNQTITVTVEGYGAGSYYYQLDNGPILNNGGVFTNVPPCSQIQENVCEHQVTIYDYAGIGDEHCDPLVIGNIHSIDYPRFFTPNGDGINDTWNITGLAGDPSAKIYIFDRYGKLLKQIRPDLNPTMGWNGVLNGEPLPSSDYWFVVYYNENGSQKEFKAHFSLKR